VGFDNEDKGEGSQEANVTAGRIKSVSVEGCVLPEGLPSGTNKAACHQRWDYVRMPVYRAFSHRGMSACTSANGIHRANIRRRKHFILVIYLNVGA